MPSLLRLYSSQRIDAIFSLLYDTKYKMILLALYTQQPFTAKYMYLLYYIINKVCNISASRLIFYNSHYLMLLFCYPFIRLNYSLIIA